MNMRLPDSENWSHKTQFELFTTSSKANSRITRPDGVRGSLPPQHADKHCEFEPGPTDSQKAELDRRLADHAANPDEVPWDDVKDSALTRIGR
jgi:hypothetical protein